MVSLQTDSFSLAVKRARFLRVSVESLMIDLSGAMHRSEAEQMVRVWTGCSSMARRSKPGTNIYRDARFWVPLIGRSIGGREDEICSLDVGDIRFEEGIPVFHISDSKTEGSERDIPIPEWLLIMGFLEHRFYGRDKTEPLFPELLPQGVEGRRSSSFSSWFTEYRRAVQCYRLLVDFHSSDTTSLPTSRTCQALTWGGPTKSPAMRAMSAPANGPGIPRASICGI